MRNARAALDLSIQYSLVHAAGIEADNHASMFVAIEAHAKQFAIGCTVECKFVARMYTF